MHRPQVCAHPEVMKQNWSVPSWQFYPLFSQLPIAEAICDTILAKLKIADGISGKVFILGIKCYLSIPLHVALNEDTKYGDM